MGRSTCIERWSCRATRISRSSRSRLGPQALLDVAQPRRDHARAQQSRAADPRHAAAGWVRSGRGRRVAASDGAHRRRDRDGWQHPRRAGSTPRRTPARTRSCPPDTARTLARYMRDVVLDGTGRSLRSSPIAIAGKTGTAEVSRRAVAFLVHRVCAVRDRRRAAIAVAVTAAENMRGADCRRGRRVAASRVAGEPSIAAAVALGSLRLLVIQDRLVSGKPSVPQGLTSERHGV